MSGIKLSILETLTKAAIDNHKMQEKLAAAIVKNGKIISIGTNSKKSHPLQARFKKNEHAIFLHAEIDAIKKSLSQIKVEDLNKCDIYITRVKKLKPLDTDYVWGVSKPCMGCLRAILQFGIRRIVYTTDANNYQIIELEN